MRMIAAEEPGSVTLFVSPSRQTPTIFCCCYFLIERARVYEFSSGACYGE